jgi:hypothetical protein
MTSDWVKLVFLRVAFNTHKPRNENVEKFDSTCAYLLHFYIVEYHIEMKYVVIILQAKN